LTGVQFFTSTYERLRWEALATQRSSGSPIATSSSEARSAWTPARRTGLANAATHVRTNRLEARVTTDNSLALLARVAAETERRCPVSNLIRDAGVQLQTRWISEATG
jgi:hypothetical protein